MTIVKPTRKEILQRRVHMCVKNQIVLIEINFKKVKIFTRIRIVDDKLSCETRTYDQLLDSLFGINGRSGCIRTLSACKGHTFTY